MIDTKKLIEELDSLLKSDMAEETLQDEVATVEEPVQPQFNDTMSLADTFDAKAKIARALENLKQAVDEFKEATSEKVDLIQDNILMQQIEGLDEVLVGIEQALVDSSMLNDTGLNDAFKIEQPAEQEVEETEEGIETDLEPIEGEEEEDEEEYQEVDFNDAAGLDLLHGEEV